MACPNCPKISTEKTPSAAMVAPATASPGPGEMCGHLRLRFLDRMQAELEANASKGDWAAVDYDYAKASRELSQHVAKLLLSVRAGDRSKVSEHAADVSVIAMKISELFGDA